MLRNNYFGETKTHYKLYKCGKNWAVMGISLFSLGLGMLVTSQPVSADVAATSTSSSSSAVKADSTGAGTTAWTATNGDTTFPAVVSPVVPGYVADKAQVPAVAPTTTTTSTSSTSTAAASEAPASTASATTEPISVAAATSTGSSAANTASATPVSATTNKAKVAVTKLAATTTNNAAVSATQQVISTTITTRPVNSASSESMTVTANGNVLQDIYSTDGKYTTTVTATNNSDSTKRVYIVTLLPNYNELGNGSKYTIAKVGLDTEATPANNLTMTGLTNESVTFSAKAGQYLSYDQYVAKKYSWDDLLAIYYQGDLAAGATATATFQTKVVNLSDMQAQMTTVDSGKATQEQAGQAFGNGTLTYSMQDFYYNGSSLVGFATPVSRIYLSKKLSSLAQEIGTTPAAEILTYDGNKTKYIPAPKAIQNVMPEITDSDLTIYYPDGTKADALWYGGSYTIDTASIFNAIKDMGYSVNVNPNGQSIWPVYTYTSYSCENVIVEYPDIKGENGDSAAVQPLYVEVQQVFDTTDKTITTKDDWVPADDLASATLKLKEPSDSYTNTENLAEDGNYTYTVTNNATGAEALSGKGTDAATKLAAGTYTVKYFYTFGDGSAVTKTATLTVLPTDNQINTATYSPKYVKAGDSVTSDVTVTNTETNETGVPTGTTFALGDGAPTWASVDGSTGTVTATPGSDVTAGNYKIPVTVTYPDGTTSTVTAEINVVSAPDKVTTSPIAYSTTYEADPTVAAGTKTTKTAGVAGVATTTTTYTVNPDTGAVTANTPTTVTTTEPTTAVVSVGTKSTSISTPIHYTTTYQADPTMTEGTTKVVTAGFDGATVATTTYTLNSDGTVTPNTTTTTTNPTNEVIAVGTKSTSTTTTIPYQTTYEADPTATAGTKAVTTPGQNGSTTTTTTYTVDPNTGEVTPTTTTTTTDPTNEVVYVGTKSTSTTTTVIPYQTVEQNDPSLLKGQTQVATTTATTNGNGGNTTQAATGAKQAPAKTLPQTGNEDTTNMSVLGLTFASLFGALGALGLRKKKEDK